MSKFKEGDKVRVVKGLHAGVTGVVTEPSWVISQSDWPVVLFMDEEGFRFSAFEEDMELDAGPVEDPYEYAMMQTRVHDNHDYTDRLVWGTLKEAQDDVDLMRPGNPGYFSYRVVKRRKAGPIEDAT